MTKAILIIIGVIVVVLLYAALVVGSRAEDMELEYWRDRARKEGRDKHGKTET